MTKGVFIFSLDCEGYWGMADLLAGGSRPRWTSAALARTYRRLLRLFDEHEVPATWAFVAAFVHTREEIRATPYLRSERIPYRGRDWAAAFKACWAHDDVDGWLCPDALDQVLRSGAHDIGAHGFSHLPLSDADTPREVATRELELLDDFWRRRGIRAATFVFPRNQTGHLGLLAERYEAYRPPHPLEVRRGPIARALRLADECNPFVRHLGNGAPGRPAALPAAWLLNHRAGARRLVPRAITLARVRSLLRQAIEEPAVVHLYSHPHNFLTGRGQFELLAAVLRLVATHVRSGELEVLTQAGYARRLRPDEGSPP